MNSLFYYSISWDLTEEKKIVIDHQVAYNWEVDHLESTTGNFVTEEILEQQNWVSGGMEITPISPMDDNSSPGFTPTNSFESDIMPINHIGNPQFDNP